MAPDGGTFLALVAGIILVVICTLPAVSNLVLRFRTRRPRQDVYQDADGTATPESIKAFSNTIQKSIVLLSALSGLVISIVLSLRSTNRNGVVVWDDWMSTIAWVALLFQAVVIVSERDSVQAYEIGVYTFLSAISLACVLLIRGSANAELLLRRDPATFAFTVSELLLSVGVAFSGLCLPRRPEVFRDGQTVDPMFTVSAITRLTFGWSSNIMKLASRKKDLDLADLPRPNHLASAYEASGAWEQHNFTQRLWLCIILAHKKQFALQWIFTVASSILGFAPMWVILQLLRILESSGPREAYGADAWVWVIWLAVAIVTQSWIDSYIYWLSSAELAIPVRAQLCTLVFRKSMRKKDVKGTSKAKKEDAPANSEGDAQPATEPATEPTPKADDEEEDAEAALKKSKQSTVNLVGVDANRLADFCAYQNLFPSSVFELVVSLIFLVSLLGWIPLVAGFSSMCAIMPINIYFSKKYSAAQDRLMKIRDEKIEVVNEALQGIRQIKFSALEPEWEKKIGAVRERELGALWDVFKGDTVLIACWITSPILLSVVSLATYAYLTGSLKPSIAFVSLGVFKNLEVTLSVVPELSTNAMDAWISTKRIEEYLKSEEVTVNSQDSDEVAFANAAIAWPSDSKEASEEDRFVLRNINVTFPKGELSVISGKTGTGKSLMLAAILGEIDVLEGTLYIPRAPPMSSRHDNKVNKSNWIIPGAIAYVAQIPWIENASIKDNILFGLPYDEDRYSKTVEVCALKKDLEMLTDGENTEIGANGINLSGGQKWRITLARAIYSRAGILVLDDIFSAVDAHVGRHIFEKCLTGELAAGRTRILVTHHVALCEPKTKYLVELGEGTVLHAGLLSELREEGALQKIKSHEQSTEEIEADESATAVDSDSSADGESQQDGGTLQKVTSRTKPTARKFVEEESRAKGAVRKHVYATYLKVSGGWLYWMVACVFFVLVQVIVLGRSWWLKEWTGNYAENNMHPTMASFSQGFGYQYLPNSQRPAGRSNSQQNSVHIMAGPSISSNHSLEFYLLVYMGLSSISSFISTTKYLYIYIGSLHASRTLFANMNFAILRAPIRWLDTVPLGRMLNRYTADFNTIDSQMANNLSFGAGSLLALVGVVISGFFVSVYIVLFAMVLLSFCLVIAVRYLNVARPVKRLDSTTKSPVFEQFGAALTGVATIRGFDKAQDYVDRMFKKLDDHTVASWHLMLFNRWMGWRMALVGSLFSSFVATLILLAPGMTSALAGFALTFALSFTNMVVWVVRVYANIELNMNATERVVEYTEIKTEDLGGLSPPAAWPTSGHIEVDNLVVGYADDLPPVLKGITFSIEHNQRVGVVGRTGAGKSSLTLALFRFLEARSGSIHVDGIDISKIKLHDLRSRLAIIPQDPVLFSGTVRSNLDPFDHHSDPELRDCLRRVHLIGDSDEGSGSATPTGSTSPASTVTPKNTNIFKSLDSPISEAGLNLSQGQRQLLCLARAMASRPRVMVLDEATSAVDMNTDSLIQRSIREEFTDATMIVIAHRLSTIADFDRVLVLSDGEVAEFGTPKELWDMGKDGIFRSMCEESGERDKLESIVLGKGQQ